MATYKMLFESHLTNGFATGATIIIFPCGGTIFNGEDMFDVSI